MPKGDFTKTKDSIIPLRGVVRDGKLAALLDHEGAEIGMPVTASSNSLTGGIEISAGGTELPVAMRAGGTLRLYNPSALTLWKRKLARAGQYGSRPVVINWVGDSMTFGITSNGSATEAATNAAGQALGDWRAPAHVQRIINARLGTPEPYFRAANDGRNVNVGGAATGSVGLNRTARSLANTAQTQTHTVTCTDFEIGVYDSIATDSDVFTGAWQYSIDDGAATNVPNAGVLRNYKTHGITGLSDASHSIVIAGAAAQASYLTHVIGWRKVSSGPGVAVCSYGVGGCAVGDLLLKGGLSAAGTAAAQARMAAAVTNQGQPDLLIVAFSHNDAKFYNTTTYSQYLDIVISLIPATTPILLLAMAPPPVAQNSDTYGARRDYWDIMAMKAAANANVFHARLSDISDVWADWSGAGLMADTSVHPSERGYACIGQAIADLLLP